MYDQIVHKTAIFNKYEQMVEKSPKELFKNTVVYGQFGSGKTTFFDYINPQMYDQKIYPIYIQLGGEFEVPELIFEFRRKMHTHLSRLHTVIIGTSMPSLEVLDDREAIVRLLKKLAEYGAKGFVVFIDDLHKGDLKKAIGFMSYLQVLTSQLVRETPDLNIGFFVAGSLEWERKMVHDLRFEGSVAREEHMPPLKLDVALDALNRRLKAFAKNPDNPRQIDRAFTEKIYKKLHYAGQDVTFRRVMREVINEFEAGHFEALSIDPIGIPVSTLEKIKVALEKNRIIRSKFFRLIYGSKRLKASQKRRCLELLIHVYLRNGLLESEIRETEAPFLQQLARVGLIVKVEAEDKLAWRISQELWYCNKQIIQRYGLSLEDYLLKIYYAEPPRSRRKVKLLGPEVGYLDTLLSSMKRCLTRKFLRDARELHVMIVESGDRYLNIEEKSANIIRKCAESLAKLTKAYKTYEKLPVNIRASDIEVLAFWKDFWWSPEVIHQFIRACTEIEDRRRAAPYIVSLYREAFPQIFNFFRDEYEKSRQFHIPLPNLKNNEIELLHDCRELWIENQYKKLAGKLTRYIERKLRTFLFDVFTVLYGRFDERIKWVDKDSRGYILKNLETERSKGFPVSHNEFQQLNRAQYRNLMTGVHGRPEGRRNWNSIFSTVFAHWNEKDLDSYLEKFAEINVKLSHLKDDSIGVPEQDYVYDFMQKSTRFIMNINQAYLRLLTRDCFEFISPANAYLSLNKFRDRQTLTPILLSKDDVSRFEEAFMGKDILKIPLDDQEYIEGIMGLSYRKTYAFLALLLTQTSKRQKETRTKLETLKSKGCEIYVCLTKLRALSSGNAR